MVLDKIIDIVKNLHSYLARPGIVPTAVKATLTGASIAGLYTLINFFQKELDKEDSVEVFFSTFTIVFFTMMIGGSISSAVRQA